MTSLIPAAPLGLALLVTCALGGALAAGDDERTRHPVIERFLGEAERVAPLVRSDAAREFLAAAQHLPAPGTRILWRDPASGRFLSTAQAEELDDVGRAGHERHEQTGEDYYLTRYGSPLNYARAIDLLGEAGVQSWHGKRVLDYGYGAVGHLRMLALAGADAVGVDVDSFLAALYSEPGDEGPVPGSDGSGRVTLVDGRWPAEPEVIEEVGAGYDVFLSKNTLKRGYINPTREADPRMLIDMGVDDATMLSQLHRVLNPGGLVLLYNLCPPEAADDEPFIPWADGRSPFPREAWEAAGFELLAFDQVDDDQARLLAFTLDWGDPPDAEPKSLFCWYTLARRLPESSTER